MDVIHRFLGVETPLGHIEGDEILHTGVFDNLDGMPDMIFDWTLCFDDVLDPQMLHGSLCRLFHTGDWRKFAGRLRVGRGRTYEIHVPAEFSAERPVVDFSQEKFDISIDDHPLASKLPRPTPEKVIFHEPPRSFSALATPRGRPTTIREFTTRDVPLIGLHIKSFNDATLVSLHYSHVLMDGPGQGELLRAWSLVLAGEAPPRLLGVHEDTVYKAAGPSMDPREETKHSLESFLMPGIHMILLMLYFLWDAVWFKMDTHTVFLPKKAIDALRSNMIEELDSTGVENKPWLSENDALQGLFGSRVAQTTPSPRPLAMRTIFDIRDRILNQDDGVFVQNAVLTGTTLFSATDVRTMSAAQIAFRGRQALKDQTSPEQAKAILRMFRRQWDVAKSGTAMIGVPSQQVFMVSSWTRANMMQAAQFGPAVLQRGKGDFDRKSPPGTMWFHHANIVRPSLFMRNILLVYGQDSEENYWLSGYFNSQTWDAVGEALTGLA